MKVLYILKHNPWGVGGGCYASKSYLYAFLEVFKHAQFTVLICSEYKKDIPYGISTNPNIVFIYSPHLNKTKSIIEFLHKSNHRHREIAKEIIKRNEFDYCIFDHSSLAGSIVDYLPPSTKTIVIHHNCEFQYFKDNNSIIRSVILLPIVRCNEKRAFSKCDYNVFLTKEDFESFKEIYGKINEGYVIGGFEFSKIVEPSFEYQKNKFVITGSLSNVQNQDGIIWYLEHFHNLVPLTYKVVIAGKSPSSLIRIKAQKFPNIELLASPKEMNPIVSDARIYICPTRLGSGIKIRIKDALRNGIPVLAHTTSARGYSDFVKAGLMYTFNDTDSFKKGLDSLLNLSDEQRRKIFSVFQEHFSFNSGCNKIKTMLNLNYDEFFE